MGLKCYSKTENAPIYENQLMVFSDSIWKDCAYNIRRTGAYIVFYQVVKINHFKHVPGTVAQYSTESEYTAAWNSGMALAHFSIPNNNLMNKDSDVV